MKVIIAGGRDFNRYDLLKHKCDKIFTKVKDLEIVSGGAKGADKLGELYALENNVKVTIFKADWNMYGKSAGGIRNSEMGDYADALIAFWDGKSPGTKHMIDYMKKLNKPTRIVYY